MISLIKNIIIIAGLVLLAGIGYYLFVLNGSATLTPGEGPTVGQADIEIQGFLRRLEELQRIEISTVVLQDPRFRSLTDFGSIIRQVPAGRGNPFSESNSSQRASNN